MNKLFFFYDVNKNSMSFCGSAEYLAPELLSNHPHSFTLDWWLLGIFAYELIVGIPPFFHKNKHRMYMMI